MKLSQTTDFTAFPRASSVIAAQEAGAVKPFGSALLAHDERHLRRRVVRLDSGDRVLVDLPEAVALGNGDRLVLDDGRQAEILAADEELYDIRGRSQLHLAELTWHIGNRHLAAQLEEHRIVILRDHVIRDMLEGLGATVTDIVEPFVPLRGAYSGGHSHGHAHHEHHDHAHDHGGHHGHGERDRFGRLPGDPHYGHNHD